LQLIDEMKIVAYVMLYQNQKYSYSFVPTHYYIYTKILPHTILFFFCSFTLIGEEILSVRIEEEKLDCYYVRVHREEITS